MSATIIHIGANKTASTTLQKALFAASPQLVYRGEYEKNYEGYAPLIQSLLSDDPSYYEPDASKQFMQSFLAEAPERPHVFSNEDISQCRVPALCCERLHDLLPAAKILLVIRSQYTALTSWYKNHGAYLRNVPSSYWRKYVSAADWFDFQERFPKYSVFDGFDYDRITRLYENHFGQENITVLLYETLVTQPAVFFEQLAALLQLDKADLLGTLMDRRERSGPTQRQHLYHRLLGRFFPVKWDEALQSDDLRMRELARFFCAGERLEQVFTPELEQKIKVRFAASNRKLAERYRLNLEACAYP